MQVSVQKFNGKSPPATLIPQEGRLRFIRKLARHGGTRTHDAQFRKLSLGGEKPKCLDTTGLLAFMKTDKPRRLLQSALSYQTRMSDATTCSLPFRHDPSTSGALKVSLAIGKIF